jgi:hypothetical protein
MGKRRKDSAEQYAHISYDKSKKISKSGHIHLETNTFKLYDVGRADGVYIKLEKKTVCQYLEV